MAQSKFVVILLLWMCPGFALGAADVAVVAAAGLSGSVAGLSGSAAGLSGTANTMPSTCGNANGSIVAVPLGGTPPYQYSLNGGPYQGTAAFQNLVGGVYSVTIMDFTGATFSFGVALGNIAGPIVSITSVAATCANNDGELDVNINGGTPPMNVTVGGVSYGNTNLIGGLASGNQFVTVTDNNGCQVAQTTTIPLNSNLTLTMGGGVTICQGKSIALSLTSNATSFNWTPTTNLTNPGVAEPVASPTSTTTYTVTAGLGVCQATGSETITVLPAPVPQANPPEINLCYGQSTQLQGSGGPLGYQWSPATYLSSTTAADPVVQQPQKSITYSLNVIGANGCTSTQPALVLVIVTPPPVVFAGDDTAVLVGQTLPLDAVDVNNAGFTSYQWTPALGLDNPSIQDPVATITGDITYTVTATTAAGCTGTDSIRIKAVTVSDIVVPNAFTPNGDGRNDVLRVHGIGIKDFKYFRVYNRWGQLVFTAVSEGAAWDGTIGGNAQPMGTYVWVAGGVDFSGRMVVRQGTVILVR